MNHTAPTSLHSQAPLGIAVFGCEADEAELFAALAPRLGVVPIITRAALTAANAAAAHGSRCASVGHKSEVSAPMLHALRDAGIAYLSSRSIGLDHIDLDEAERLGITVGNVTYSPDGVADYTVMLMLMALRNAKAVVSSAQRCDYRLGSVRGRELRDLTVGIVGVGQIGEAIIRRLSGFGCRVLACSTTPRPLPAEYVPLEKLLAASDIISLHVPHRPETHHLIGRREIAAMRDGALLINTGRGALVDTAALVEALDGGRLGGAALDVVEGEEGLFYFDCTARPTGNAALVRLQRMPNVIVTPHTAYYTRRALHDTVENTIRNCQSFDRSRNHD